MKAQGDIAYSVHLCYFFDAAKQAYQYCVLRRMFTGVKILLSGRTTEKVYVYKTQLLLYQRILILTVAFDYLFYSV